MPDLSGYKYIEKIVPDIVNEETILTDGKLKNKKYKNTLIISSKNDPILSFDDCDRFNYAEDVIEYERGGHCGLLHNYSNLVSKIDKWLDLKYEGKKDS